MTDAPHETSLHVNTTCEVVDGKITVMHCAIRTVRNGVGAMFAQDVDLTGKGLDAAGVTLAALTAQLPADVLAAAEAANLAALDMDPASMPTPPDPAPEIITFTDD